MTSLAQQLTTAKAAVAAAEDAQRRLAEHGGAAERDLTARREALTGQVAQVDAAEQAARRQTGRARPLILPKACFPWSRGCDGIPVQGRLLMAPVTPVPSR
ncbi:hypothetical protein [Streptosporangium sp. KLBMP 9127]|nr:hypothetical protein [Streptosporangium sp. KLBMP 9127]